MSDELVVHLHGIVVGRLMRSAHTDTIEFKLERTYLQRLNRPVLGQYFLDRDEEVLRSRVRLPPYFSNLLPEGVLRELLAKRAGVNPAREFFLLAELGADLPGALEIAAPEQPAERDELDDVFPAAVGDSEPLKFSLAGLQLKFGADPSGDRWRLPARGIGARWLLKLPDARFPLVPRNEFAMMEWARAVGLDVPRVKLVAISDVVGLPQELTVRETHALAVERFDRVAESRERIHTEDFLQVLNSYPDNKYRATNVESVARIIASIGGLPDFRALVERLVFNLVIGNGDAHLKNWSLIYRDGRTARLLARHWARTPLLGEMGLQ